MGIGIAWALLGAFFLGTFALPSKYIKNFAWENTWGAFFLFGMLIVPVGFACLTVTDLWGSYAGVPTKTIFYVVALGFLWGCGFCCWGYGLSMLGLSMGYALTMGTMALLGSMIPFLLGSSQYAASLGGLMVMGGIFICITGVGINGYAGVQRDKSQAGGEGESEGESKKINIGLGLIVCVIAGVLSSGLNIAFHIGGDIFGNSEALGNPGWMAGLAVWTLIFLGGMISSVTFSVIQLCKNKTWAGFKVKESGKNLVLSLIMAIGHFACIFFYGLAVWQLNNIGEVKLGTSVGFAIFQSGAVILGISLGFFTGEWKGASQKSRRWLLGGLAVLILGIAIASWGTGIIQKEKTKKVKNPPVAMQPAEQAPRAVAISG